MTSVILNVPDDSVLSQIKTCVDSLVSNKQAHLSHQYIKF